MSEDTGQDGRFFTPRPPAPLNLDLASLSGGGAYPAQFYGETHDGRAVYVRYRGGALSVQIAPEPGEDAVRGETVLDWDDGPPWDGELSRRSSAAWPGSRSTARCPRKQTPTRRTIKT
ncbi:hypothetical protein [Mesobacterium pallidum]|uniref:hypothetical protein n=1 Tax=Mesobacterium pallidum TaxID=2872037 RepID=UPI001EE2545D|nr:hypothetical protein [Mesobacterium pallidum]